MKRDRRINDDDLRCRSYGRRGLRVPLVPLLVLMMLFSGLMPTKAQPFVEIGAETQSSHLYGPIYRSSASSSWDYSNYTYIFLASELASLPAGAIITELSWEKANSEGMTGNNHLEIMMENTMQSQVLATSDYTAETVNSTQVFLDNSYTVPATTGWLSHTLTTPFIYTGDNLKISVGHIMNGTPTGAIPFYYSTVSGLAGGRANSSPTVSQAYNSSYSNSRPNIRIHYILPNISDDAGVASIDEPTFPTEPGIHDVKATITTVGNNPLTSCTINWAINGVTQTPYAWTGNLAQFGTAGPITLGNFNFPQGVNEIMVWTTNPNNQADSFPGNDTAIVEFLFTSPLSGTYTVGGPTADFPDLDSIIVAMDAGGISGPVTFSFNPAFGPYTGSVEFNDVAGSSATNTITLQGNGSVINEGTTNYVIAIDGLSHLTIVDFNIVNSDPTNNIFGIMIRGGAQHINITNNFIDMGTDYTSSASGCIVISGSTTSAVSTGNNAQYVTITNNELVGAYYGITLYGLSSYQDNYGHVVTDNIIRDFHHTGMRIQDGDSLLIARNNLSRENRQTTYGVFYGMYSLRMRHSTVIDNHIHSTGPTSSTCYGIYHSASANSLGYEMEYINNAIYNFTTTGIVYGMYLLGTREYVNLYHNTVQMAANGSSNARALWMSTSPDYHDLKNNIFSVEGPGTGTKYAVYVTSTSTSFTANNNLYYNGSTGGTNYIGRWGTSDEATLSDWQLATSQDGNSLSVNPNFPALDDFKSTSIDIWKAGTPLPTVTTDIFGTPRDPVEPCIGAYEFELMNNDAGINEMTEPTAICAGPADVKVKVMNYGIAPLNSVTIEWSVNGVAQTPVSPTGLGLAPSTDTVITLGSYTFLNNVPYDFVINTTLPNGVADQQTDNDTLVVQGLLSGLAGTLTIGGGVGDDFSSFADAVDALNSRGLCGPVVFNVNAADGPYTGGVELGAIEGISATNNIVFNGNGAVLNEDLENYVIALDGISHLTINDFQIINSDPSNNIFGIMIRGGAQHINITNNFIDMGTDYTSSASGCIVISGSTTSAITTGNNAQYVTIINNELVGAYYGISLYGASSYQDNYGHVVTDNIIRDWHYYGMRIQDGDSLLIARNNLSRADRQSTYTIFYGMHITRLRHSLVADNHIHTTGPTSSSSYGIRTSASDNNAAYPTEYINNAIYNFTTTGISYGFYMLGVQEHVNIYHNTVDFDNEGSGNRRALWVSSSTTQADNLNVMNNIFSIDGHGDGEKYCIYMTNAITFNANHNVLHMGATLGDNYIGRWGAANDEIDNLPDWQMATMQDAMSVNVNPVLAAPAFGDPTPLSMAIDNMGTPLGVTTDIFGNPRSTTTPDVGAIEFTGIAADLAMVGGELVNGECLSSNDSVYITFSNVIGGTVNFSTATTTAYWEVTGPVNSSGSIVVNSGTLNPAAQITVGGDGVDMSEPGTYTLSVWLDMNPANLFDGNDTLFNIHELELRANLAVTPKQVVITSPHDTVELSAFSTFFPGGGFFITEVCHWRGSSNGTPTGGWPGYLIADDYIEITGVPNSDLGGYTLEQWESSMVSTHTFPAGTVVSPNGTAIIAVGQMGSSVESPADFYYHGEGAFTGSFSSTDDVGRILRDPSGNIVDAVVYGTFTFPSAAGVTPADWTGSTPSVSSTGNALHGPYTKDATNWVNVGSGGVNTGQMPNQLNPGVIPPTPGTLTGFSWSLDGVVIADNVIDTVVGPWTVNGTYHYVASYITPCGILTDTVTVIVSMVIASSDTTICEGDTVQLFVDLPGTAPWSLVVTDGVDVDTISGIPASPFTMSVWPTTTTTYAVLAYQDASEVWLSSNVTTTVNVNPLPLVTIDAFAPMCEYESPIFLTGGLPTGGDYSGVGVYAGEFDPAMAGVGAHTITYQYTDLNGCSNHADTVIEVHAAPVATITGAQDTICHDAIIIIDAGAGFDTYLWSDNSTGQTLSVDGATIGVNNSVTYSVTVTNIYGCEDAATVTITAIDCTSIEELEANGNMLLYPNPNDGNFVILLTGVYGKATLRVVRSTGDLVYIESLTLQGELSEKLRLDHLASGVYYVQILTENGVITQKMVIL